MSENLNTLSEDLNLLNEDIDKIFSDLKLKTREKFRIIVDKHIFDKYPELDDFGWVQYTPYFNDGEECYFTVDSYMPWINGYHPDYEYIDNYDEVNAVQIHQYAEDKIWDNSSKSMIQNPSYNEYYAEIVKAVSSFIDSVDNKNLKLMFGDHKKIFITRTKMIITEFDHE